MHTSAFGQLIGDTAVETESLPAEWAQLDEEEMGEITRNHLRGLVRAMHKYHDEKGSLPPAVIPNEELPPEKRLSGFVLLLPYLDARDFSSGGELGNRFFDDEIARAAKTLYDSIDRSKAWDDPANLEAARSVVPAFLAPGIKPIRSEDGYALAHFAFVRGALGKDNGAFTNAAGITIKDITDGTDSTLALGQVDTALGPWIAAGPATSRHVYHPSVENDALSFGGPYKGGAYFVNVDSFAYFLNTLKTKPEDYHALATRSGREINLMSKVSRSTTAREQNTDR
ncbi:DUF1559 family PulG-like putative transporter [Novipirellula galeiformis]|nr:DUF1559 domain-containing protein [Novipirellula galeiformis]